MKITGKKDIVSLKLRALKHVKDYAVQQVNSVMGDYTTHTFPLLQARYQIAINYLQDTRAPEVKNKIYTALMEEAASLKTNPEALANLICNEYDKITHELFRIDTRKKALIAKIKEAESPAAIFRLTGVE